MTSPCCDLPKPELPDPQEIPKPFPRSRVPALDFAASRGRLPHNRPRSSQDRPRVIDADRLSQHTDECVSHDVGRAEDDRGDVSDDRERASHVVPRASPHRAFASDDRRRSEHDRCRAAHHRYRTKEDGYRTSAAMSVGPR
jgi:hypothetical protein